MPTPDREKLLKKYGKKLGKPVEKPTSPETPADDETVKPVNETVVQQPDDPRTKLLAKYATGKPKVKPKPQAKAEVDVEVSYTSEDNIETGTYTALPDIDEIEYNGLTFADFRKMYADGASAGEVDNAIVTHLNEINGDREAVRNFMSTFFEGLRENLFDSSKTTCDFGEETEEILSRVLANPEDETLTGWVCSNIHDLGMRYMHKCNMQAAVVSCKSNMGAGHAILIYKSGDGKYTFMNYGHADEVEANSIVDAVCKLQSSDPTIMSNGTICFVDEKGSYCKYALEDDAIWGNKIDKSAYNGAIPTADIVPEKTNLSVQLNTSNLNDKSAIVEGALLLGKHKRSALTGGIGYQTNSNSQIFDSSEAFGAQLGFKTVSGGDKTKTYFGADVIADYTLAHYQPIPTETGEREQCAEYLTTFARGVAGVENNFRLTENTTLTNTAQLSAGGYLAAGITLGTSFNGDGRVALEDALKLTNKIGDVTFQNTLNGGLVVDMKKTSGAQELGFQLGSKFNADSSVMVTPDNNWSYGIGVNGYSVFTPTATDYGVGAKTFITYKPDSSGVVFSGNAGVNYNHQNINIGGIKETVENNTGFYAQVSAKQKKNTFTVGYNGKIDGINPTRNNSTFMVKYTRSF